VSRFARATWSTLAAIALVGGASVASPRLARADDTPIAESLFQQGVAAMERGDYATACTMLADSQRLDPGGGTLLNLALCHERAGKIATAWARYHDALGIARRDAREDRLTFATEHIKALEPRLPRLSIVLSEPLDGARAKLDGIELPAAAWASPSPLDPGEHVLRIEAPGRAPWSTTIAVIEAQTRRVTVPRLGLSALSATGDAATPSGEAPRGRTQRILGWSFTGAGGGTVIASAVLGVLAIGAESTADASCPSTGTCTSPRGLDASDRAGKFATAATISAVAGLVMLAGGIVLLVAAPSR
jgi:hypothetical protein